MFAGFRITISYMPELYRVFLWCDRASKFNRLIRCQALTFDNAVSLYHAVGGIAFQARNEKYSFFCQLVIPRIIVITYIERHHAAFWETQQFANIDFMLIALADRNKFWQVSRMV